MKHLKMWKVRRPCPTLNAIVSHYEFVEFDEASSLGESNLLCFPGFINAFLFCFYQGDPIRINNASVGDVSIPASSLIPPVSLPTYNVGVQRLRAIRVIFQPGALWHIYAIPMKEFTNQTISLRHVIDRDLGFLHQKLWEAPNEWFQIKVIEEYLLTKIRFTDTKKDLFGVLQKLLFKKQYSLSVSEIAQDIGITSRQLQRTTNSQFGFSPKEFISIHRFNCVLDQLNKGTRKSLTEITYDFNYYDQSHFIREFKRWSSMAPRSYVQKKEDEKVLLTQMHGKIIPDR